MVSSCCNRWRLRARLASDHQHYWEDGGCTYHTRYNTWEIARGQEGDPWKGDLRPMHIPEHIGGRPGAWDRQDWINRCRMTREEDQPQSVTFANGIEFIRTNHAQDNWFLHIETFDPHEPFFTQKEYQDLYPHEYDGPLFDWPDYNRVKETPEQVQHLRYMYAALLSMCDRNLGKILDLMDEFNLWKDTLLIVNTDHGFLLSEHDWWAKCVQPFYNEVAHTPLFIWDPRITVRGVHRQALVQTIDLAPTLLEYFGLARPADMQGQPLRGVIQNDAPIRDGGLFGLHGGHVNVTDGRYVYMRAPREGNNTPLFDYTLMPTHMRAMFSVEELRAAGLHPPFSFTKDCPVLKVPGKPWTSRAPFETLLFDLQEDPAQMRPLQDPSLEKRMIDLLISLMQANQAPQEQYIRLGLV